jgi:hypothetical protein
MIDEELYCQHKLDECRELARNAVTEDDRIFWQQAAEHWAGRLREAQTRPSKKPRGVSSRT